MQILKPKNPALSKGIQKPKHNHQGGAYILQDITSQYFSNLKIHATSYRMSCISKR